MKENRLLTGASLLSIGLLTIHVTHDIVLGISKAESSNFYAVFYFVILLCGPVLLAGRRSGYVMMFLGGLIALGMPAVHMTGARYAERVSSAGPVGGFFFVWTLFALGIVGVFTMMLSARALWTSRKGKRVIEPKV